MFLEKRKNSYDGYYKRSNGSHRIQEINRGNQGGLLTFSYDLGGRIIEHIQLQTGDTTGYFWDGASRLRGVYRRGYLSYHQYSGGQKVLKAVFKNRGVRVNGRYASNGLTLKGWISYPNEYTVVDEKGNYSKHYYIGGKRICSQVIISKTKNVVIEA